MQSHHDGAHSLFTGRRALPEPPTPKQRHRPVALSVCSAHNVIGEGSVATCQHGRALSRGRRLEEPSVSPSRLPPGRPPSWPASLPLTSGGQGRRQEGAALSYTNSLHGPFFRLQSHRGELNKTLALVRPRVPLSWESAALRVCPVATWVACCGLQHPAGHCGRPPRRIPQRLPGWSPVGATSLPHRMEAAAPTAWQAQKEPSRQARSSVGSSLTLGHVPLRSWVSVTSLCLTPA